MISTYDSYVRAILMPHLYGGRRILANFNSAVNLGGQFSMPMTLISARSHNNLESVSMYPVRILPVWLINCLGPGPPG